MKNITTTIALALTAASLTAATTTDGWESSADFGLTLTQGNSETLLVTTAFNFANDNGDIQQLAGVSYTFGEAEGSKTTDVLNSFYTWNKLATETTYYGFRVEGTRDDIALIDYRIQATALYGVHLVKNDTTTFSLEFGPGYTAESVGDVESNSAHIYFGQRASYKFSENTFFTQTLAAYGPFEDFEKYNFVFTIAAESKMSDNMSLRVALENTYTNSPAAGAEKNDLKLISGISYKF